MKNVSLVFLVLPLPKRSRSMKKVTLKTVLLIMTMSFFALAPASAQEGSVTVNQNPEIDKLLELKKDISVEEERFKIQIYSGSRSAAEAAKANFQEAYPQYSSSLEYETPNYKIWIGNFRSRLEADRALVKVKRKFTSAFIFKPGK